MTKKPRDKRGICIRTWDGEENRTRLVFATEKMRCQACKECLRVPGSDRCIYGGPFGKPEYGIQA